MGYHRRPAHDSIRAAAFPIYYHFGRNSPHQPAAASHIFWGSDTNILTNGSCHLNKMTPPPTAQPCNPQFAPDASAFQLRSVRLFKSMVGRRRTEWWRSAAIQKQLCTWCESGFNRKPEPLMVKPQPECSHHMNVKKGRLQSCHFTSLWFAHWIWLRRQDGFILISQSKLSNIPPWYVLVYVYDDWGRCWSFISTKQLFFVISPAM